MYDSTNPDTVVGTVTIPITQELVETILTCAFEGGISSWCAGAHDRNGLQGTTDHDTYGPAEFCYRLRDRDSGRWFEDCHADLGIARYRDLDLAALIAGVAAYVEIGGTLDLGALDATNADWIVQMAVFGEIVFG